MKAQEDFQPWGEVGQGEGRTDEVYEPITACREVEGAEIVADTALLGVKRNRVQLTLLQTPRPGTA